MMLLAGLIGGRTGRTAMETVKMSFGQRGGLRLPCCRAAIGGLDGLRTYDGALAIGGIFAVGHWVWCLVIGALIVLWIAVGVTDLGWINKLTMAALFLLTLVLCKVIFFSGNAVTAAGEAMSFGAAVELAVAMPLSWLPLISDYTSQAQKPTQATWVSVIVYGLVSCWMYVIGMGAAMFTGEYDIAVIMVKAGLGVARPGHPGLLHRDHHVFGRLVRRYLRRVPVPQAGREEDGHRCDHRGRGGGHPVPHGRHHRVLVSHRLGVCPHDRRADR